MPKERYDSEVKRLRRSVEEIDRFVPPIGGEPDAKAAQTKRKKERERCVASQDKLKLELSQQQKAHAETMGALRKSNGSWFSDTQHRGADAMNHFLQCCVFPRCVFTPADAVYCAKFVLHTHSLGTPMFSTLQYYDKLLRDISVHTFSCTERQVIVPPLSRSSPLLSPLLSPPLGSTCSHVLVPPPHRQAANLGRFLNASLAQLLHWKSHEEVYRTECAKLPGFSVSFSDTANSKKATYEDYVKVVFKWYCKILKSLMLCLESAEYMEVRDHRAPLGGVPPTPPPPAHSGVAPPHTPLSSQVRNALHVLTRVIDVFPKMKKLSDHLEKRVDKLRTEERKDLQMLASQVVMPLPPLLCNLLSSLI